MSTSSIQSRAYVLREVGKVPSLELISVSTDLQPGQVLIRLLFSALCATQVEEIFFGSANKKYIPHLFGHEGVGLVVKVGPGVTNLQEGDTCVMHWRSSSLGLDAVAGSYTMGGATINSGPVSTFSEFAVAPENRLTKIPEGVDTKAGALLGCSLTTGYGALVHNGKFERGDTLLVLGLGGVGSAVITSARALGGERIIGIDTNPERFAQNEGLSEFYNSLEQLEEKYLEASIKHYPNLVVDTTGEASILERLVDWLPASSRIVLVGKPKQGSRARINTQKLLDGLRIEGSNGGQVDPGQEIATICHKLGKANLEAISLKNVEFRSIEDLEKVLSEGLYKSKKFIFSF